MERTSAIFICNYAIFICNYIIDNYKYNYNYCGMGNEQGKEPYYLDAKKANPMKSSTNKNTFQDYEQGHQYNEGMSNTGFADNASVTRATSSAIMIFMILLLVILLANLLLRSRKKKNI